MTRLALLGGLVLALSFSTVAADDKKEVPKELAPFQGTWKATKVEMDGKVTEGAKLQFTFDGTKVIFLQGEKETGTGSIAVDATKTPNEIDLFTEKGTKSPGIYKFENDDSKLLICFVRDGKERPKAFNSIDLPKAVVLTLEKVKK
jgi:uncharacterized protein (TIGR03067 family)